MKIFTAYLRDGRTVTIRAENYRQQGDRYVFAAANEGEEQFFAASEIIGISEVYPAQPIKTASLADLLDDYERRVITNAFELNRQNLSHTAKQLQITRHALRYRMQRLGLNSGSISDDGTNA